LCLHAHCMLYALKLARERGDADAEPQ